MVIFLKRSCAKLPLVNSGVTLHFWKFSGINPFLSPKGGHKCYTKGKQKVSPFENFILSHFSVSNFLQKPAPLLGAAGGNPFINESRPYSLCFFLVPCKKISSPCLTGQRLPELCWLFSGSRTNFLRCSWCAWVRPWFVCSNKHQVMWVQSGVHFKGAKFSDFSDIN